MDTVSLQIINDLADKREMTIRELTDLVPKKHNSHLDFYILASLVKNGYIDLTITLKDKDYISNNEKMIAMDFYIWSNKSKEDFEYQGTTTNGADFRDEIVFTTAKIDLLLNEIHAKSEERKWTLRIGITIAIIASVLTAVLT